MKNIWPFVRYLLLSIAVLVTLWVQTLFGNVDMLTEALIPFTWFVLIVGWFGRVAYGLWKKPDDFRFRCALPIAMFVIVLFQRFQVPLYFVWAIDRPAFERALRLPASPNTFSSTGPRIGRFRAYEIAKSQGATRFALVFTSRFLDGIISGYTHCPDGCSTIDFPKSWGWHSNDRAVYYPLGQGWYAWKEPYDFD